ncbi:hypothetical protein GCM10023085_72950 [Actinomadura viridis]|uniref:Uncharacterized protein n=1 Tax=Actinomadura viridis TaxID=58110 RepID=A0A931GRK3_9ACTN|nr:hypothetical protein [Actinomadura viridis]
MARTCGLKKLLCPGSNGFPICPLFKLHCPRMYGFLDLKKIRVETPPEISEKAPSGESKADAFSDGETTQG